MSASRGRAKQVRQAARARVRKAGAGKGKPPSEALARGVLRAAVPAMRRRRGQGMAAVVAVAEAVGGEWDLVCAVTDHTATIQSANTAAQGRGVRQRINLGTGGEARRLAAVLSALGSVHRVKILVKLLEGPGTYRTLQKATRLKAGPLYHHVAQLRLAGLIGPKERDLYELTRGGRNLILVVLTLPKLIKDQRRRPVPGLAR